LSRNTKNRACELPRTRLKPPRWEREPQPHGASDPGFALRAAFDTRPSVCSACAV